MGIAVFAGMIGVTAFGLFLTPVFYVLLRALTGNRPLKHHGDGDDAGGVRCARPRRRRCPRAGREERTMNRARKRTE